MNFTRVLVALLAVLACAVGAASASAADLHATPATLSSVYAGAAGGDNVLLASGSYSAFNGGAKSSMVTLKPEPGASPSINGGQFNSAVRNLTIQGINYTGPIGVYPGTTALNLVFDGITMANVGREGHEGRMSIIGGGTNALHSNGVQVKNSTFGPNGCSDGIQDSSKGTEIGPGNTFTGIVQNCPSTEAHVDAIQPYDSNYIHIHDNNLTGNEQGIMAPDGPSTGWLIENNVIHTTNAYPTITLGHAINGTVRHNVSRNGNIRVYGGNEGVNSSGMVITDNVGGVNNDGCTGCTITNNPPVSSITYTGGSGRCAYATASPKGTATDGTDVGLNDCAGSPPPPTVECNDGINNDPTEDTLIDYPNDPGCSSATDTTELGNPVGDSTPVAAFTHSPSPSAQNQTVTFDATGSTCADAPCTYYWHDIDSTGTGDWPIGPAGGGSVVTQAFSGLGTKYVELVLTDADGDVDRVEHDHVVQSAPAPDTTPPDTTITSGPSNGTSTSASVSFTGTDNVGVDHFDCRIDAGAYSVCTSPKSYTGLAVGTHTIDVKAVDAAGNADPSAATVTWTISAPPTGGPPTYVGHTATAWNTATSPKNTAAITVQGGDVLVACASAEDSGTLAISSLGGITWTSRASFAGDSGHAAARCWSGAVPTGVTSTTVAFSRSGTGGFFGGDVLQYRNSSGIGVAGQATGTGAPSLTLAGVSANSAIVKSNVDWSAKDGASRASRTTGVGAFTETAYFRDAARYTTYVGYHANAGVAGSKTIGYTAPTAQAYTLLGVEVKGT